jgi:hypothetical protein
MFEVSIGVEVEAKGDSYGECFDYGGTQKFLCYSQKGEEKLKLLTASNDYA